MTDDPRGNAPGEGGGADSIILEEEIDPNYVPSDAEVVEYAKWLGMELDKDQDLFWIAREGLMAPLPKNWKPCKTKDTEDIYYFNFATGESTWDHPCDGYYKRLYEEEKKKREMSIKASGDENRTKAKQDVEQLLGKGEKKKKKSKSDLNSLTVANPTKAPPSGSANSSLASLERKPLPGIKASVSVFSYEDINQPMSLIDPVSGSRSLSSPLAFKSGNQGDSDSDNSQAKPSRSSSQGGGRRGGDSRDVDTPRDLSKSRLGNRLQSALSDSGDGGDGDGPDTPLPMRDREREMERGDRRTSTSSYSEDINTDKGNDQQRRRHGDELKREEEEHQSELRRLRQRWQRETDEALEEHERSLKARKKDWDEEVDEMKDKLRKQRSQMQQEYDDVDADYQKRLRSHKERCLELEDKQRVLATEVEQLQQRASKARASGDLDSQRGFPDQTPSKTENDLRNKLRVAVEEADGLHRQIERMESRLSEYEDVVKAAERAAEQKISRMREDHENELGKLKRQLREARETSAAAGSESSTDGSDWVEEKSRFNGKIKDLTVEVSRLEDKLSDKEKELRQREASNNQQQHLGQTASQELQRMQRERDETERVLKGQLVESQQEASSLQRKLSQLTRDLDDVKTTFKDAVTRHESDQQSLRQELQSVRGQERQQLQQFGEIQLSLEKGEEEIRKLKRELEHKTQQLNDARTDAEQQRAKLSSALSHSKSAPTNSDSDVSKTSSPQLQALLDDQEKEIGRLRQQIRATESMAEADVARLEGKCRDAQDKLIQLNTEIVTAKATIYDFQSRYRELEQRMDRKESDAAELDKKLKIAKAAERDSQENMEKLRMEMTQLRSRMQFEAEQATRTVRALQEKEAELVAARKGVGSLGSDSSANEEALHSELEKIRRELRESRVIAEDAQLLASQREEEVRRLRSEIITLSETVQTVRMENRRYEDDVVHLNRVQTQLQQLQLELVSTRGQLEQKEAELTRQREEWSRQSSNDDSVRALFAELEIAKQDASKKYRLNSQLESELNELKLQINQMDQEARRSREEILRLVAIEEKHKAVTTERDSVDTELQSIRAANSRGQIELEESRRVSSQKDADMTKMREELMRVTALSEDRCTTIASEREAIEQELVRKSRLQSHTETELNDMKFQMGQKDQEIRRLREEVSRLVAIEERARSVQMESGEQLQRLRDTITKMERQQQQSSALSENEQISTLRRDFEQSLSTERTAALSKDRQLREALDELAQLKQRLIFMEQERDQKQALLDNRSSDREKESPLVTSLRLDLSHAAARMQELEGRMRLMQQRCEVMEVSEQSLVQQLDEARSMSSKLRLSSEVDGRVLEDARQRTVQITEEIAVMRKDKEKALESLRSAEIEKERMQVKLLGLEHGATLSQQRESQLQQERDRERERNRTLETSNRDFELKIIRLQSELDQAKLQISQLRSQETQMSAGREGELEALTASRRAEAILQAEFEGLKRESAMSRSQNEDRIAVLQRQLKMQQDIIDQMPYQLSSGGSGDASKGGNHEEVRRLEDQLRATEMVVTQLSMRLASAGNDNGNLEGPSDKPTSVKSRKDDGKKFFSTPEKASVRQQQRHHRDITSPPSPDDMGDFISPMEGDLSTGGGGEEVGNGDHRRGGSSSESSLLLAVLRQLFLRSRDRHADGKSGRTERLSPQRRGKGAAVAEDFSQWERKISEEKKSIKNAMAALRDEKESIRKKQSRLAQKRQSWKAGRSALAHGRSNGTSKFELKRAAEDLNRQAEELNQRVATARKCGKWLEAREHKVARMEGILEDKQRTRRTRRSSSSHGAKSSLGYHTDSSDVESPSSSISSLLEHVGKELDADMESFESFGTSTASSPPSTSDDRMHHLMNEDYGTNKKGRTPRSSSAGRVRASLVETTTGSGGKRKRKDRRLPEEQVTDGNRYFYDHHDRVVDGPPVPFYSLTTQNLPPQARGWFYAADPILTSSWSAGLPHQPTSSTMMAHMPAMMGGAWTGVASSAADSRRQLNMFVGDRERVKPKDAYDDHASWLDGLRREIGRFSHEHGQSPTGKPALMFSESDPAEMKTASGLDM
eukprot:gene2146-4178_t